MRMLTRFEAEVDAPEIVKALQVAGYIDNPDICMARIEKVDAETGKITVSWSNTWKNSEVFPR